MRTRRRLVRFTCVLAASLATGGAAHAYDKDAVDAPGWRYELQPYASLPLGVSGTATVLDHSVPIDVSASDLFKSLKMAAELRFEAWNGPWGLIAGGQYARLADSEHRADLTFDFKSDTYLGQVMAAYRLGWWHGGERQPSFAVDVFAGGQVTYLVETLDVAGSRQQSTTRLKLIGEVRPILRFSPTWALVGRCLVGGPDLIVSAGGAVELDVSRVAIRLGYGYDKIDDSSSSDHVSLDVHSNGPYVGLGIRFGAGPIF